jgi:hypothetical protein
MSKNRFLTLAFSLLIVGILHPPPRALGVHASLEILDLLGNVPDIQTPQELKNVWLRFHKDNLCQKFDAAFVFEKFYGRFKRSAQSTSCQIHEKIAAENGRISQLH